jgi:hypothetical protein
MLDTVKEWTVKAGVSLLMGKLLASRLHVNRPRLDDMTECIGEDYELYHLFKAFQRFQSIHPVAYEQAIVEADKLLHLRLLLGKNEVQPTLQDRPVAYGHFIGSKESLEKLLNCAKSSAPAKTVVVIFNLYEKISRNLEGHWLAVMKMTTEVV